MLFLRGYKLISKKIKIDNVLQKFNQVFESNGFKAYLVGGAVRDIFLNKPCSDWDVATNAKPEDVMKMFNFVVPTGIAHGTVTVHFMKEEIEVTTFRTESDYSDGRHPDKIEYAATIEEDLSRRDFTMNAIAVSSLFSTSAISERFAILTMTSASAGTGLLPTIWSVSGSFGAMFF